MSKTRAKNKIKKVIIGAVIIILISICEYINLELQESRKKENTQDSNQNKFGISIDLSDIPDFTNEPYVIINNNIPSFDSKDYATESFEQYSQLDILGRCGVAYANISRATMPPDGQERENINFIHPSGWRQKRYNGEYLYNRCHLIGYQLSSENANELNLITGTRYMNVEGMLPFENQVAEYINEKEDENRHVLYRVTPIFEGDNLIASGVQMEAYSVEDNGESVCFNVYVYNVQPGVNIDYETGRSWIEK